MEDIYLEILKSLADARKNFFRRASSFRRNQEDLIQRFTASEHDYIDMLARIQTRAHAPLYINFPINIPAGFMDPVAVLPTAAQIANELIPFAQGASQVSCAICQDVISSDGCRLRGCEHAYHNVCIRTWFGASTNCPVCRRDIRGDSGGQTLPAAQETPSQEMNQWGGGHT
jgi:hypothetical protein